MVSLVGLSFPAFVSGILMLIVFAIQLGWFPVLGAIGGGASLADHLRVLALPAVNLGLIMMAYVMRPTRAAMLGVLGKDYIRTARAKGVGPTQLVWRHAFLNSLTPIITVVGLCFGTLIGNSVLTEAIFNRPGVPPPVPTWGGMIREGSENILDAWSLAVFPSIAILLAVLALNLLGDALRDAANPRSRTR